MSKKARINRAKNGNLQVADIRMALRPKNLYAFASDLVAGVDEDTAAKNANSGLTANELMDHPEFTDAIIAAVHHSLTIGLMPKALAALTTLLKSKNEKTKLAAAKLILDKTVPDVRKGEADNPQHDIETMEIDELTHMVKSLESELADRAKPVNADGSDAKPAQAFDFME